MKAGSVLGDIVECGVWKGGMSAGMASILGNSRAYHLFDSFEGLPPAESIDGTEALAYQQDKSHPHYFDNCAADETFARTCMDAVGVDFYLHKGWFENTVPGFRTNNGIALLRLDGDWYSSTMTCLQHLFPLVNKNGIVIFDDYFNWDGCTLAVHDYLSLFQKPYRLQTTESGVCYIIKSQAGC
jgi:hypothetical protein